MNKKLLAISFSHDSAISFWDGSVFKYSKLERYTKIKHDEFSSFKQLKNFIKNSIHEDLNTINDICVVTSINMSNIILDEIELFCEINKIKLHIIGHHYAHYLSERIIHNDSDVYINIDGQGDDATFWTVYRNNELIDSGIENNFPYSSLGLFIEFVLGYYCGVDTNTNGNDVAGKYMSLQSYGNINDDLLDEMKEKKISLQTLSDFETIFDKFVYLKPLDMGRTFHHYVEHYLLPNFFKQYAKENEKISYSGGVAHNVVWNTQLKKMFPNLIINPHCYDGGLSLGGIEYLRELYELPNIEIKDFPYISQSEIPENEPSLDTIKKVAKLLSENKVVGWYQGHGEIGPRALGNRSILMNPLISDGRDLINKIKKREYYRPFGATVLNEHKDDYFDIGWESPYMLYLAKVKDDRLKSITHIDNTCRIQTLKDENVSFRILLEEFYKLTGIPILLNTSLNVAGEPIAGYEEQAIQIFNETDIDYMVVGDDIYETKFNYS
jgi:carbamoyltransferase